MEDLIPEMTEADIFEELDTRRERAIRAVNDLKKAEERIFNKIKKRMEELAKDPVLLKEMEDEITKELGK